MNSKDLISKSYQEKQYANITALPYMLRKNRSGPSNLTEDAKYINKMLFRAITFNITHTLLPRVGIT